MDFNSLKMRQFEDSAIHIAIEEKSSDETQDDSDDLIYTEFPTPPILNPDLSQKSRKKKKYTVISRKGFQTTEYVTIMSHLCKAEILISSLFFLHGTICPGYPDHAAYQGTCHMNVVSATVGILAGLIGIGAIYRYRWRTMLVVWLVMCIIAAVGNLLSIIHTGVWLDHLSKLKDRTGVVNGLSGFMLLIAVAVGVCFILTAVMICHYWSSSSTNNYTPIGRVSKIFLKNNMKFQNFPVLSSALFWATFALLSIILSKFLNTTPHLIFEICIHIFGLVFGMVSWLIFPDSPDLTSLHRYSAGGQMDEERVNNSDQNDNIIRRKRSSQIT